MFRRSRNRILFSFVRGCPLGTAKSNRSCANCRCANSLCHGVIVEPGIGVIRHDSRRMRGRDPHEMHRAATPLELLFDLTFATSFGLAASEVAPVLAEGHLIAGLVGFGFASFAICWAWINFSWFSSA